MEKGPEAARLAAGHDSLDTTNDHYINIVRDRSVVVGVSDRTPTKIMIADVKAYPKGMMNQASKGDGEEDEQREFDPFVSESDEESDVESEFDDEEEAKEGALISMIANFSASKK